MMSAYRKPDPSKRRSGLRRAFTLVEILIGLTIGLAVLGAVASTIVMMLRMVHENQQIDSATTTTRLVQEHLGREMSVAISRITPVEIRPTFTNSSGTTPARYAQINYRVPLGSFGSVLTTTSRTLSTIVVDLPTNFASKVSDYPKAGDVLPDG